MTSFTPQPAPHLPISRSTVTGKPGRSAVSGFGAGCGAAITRRPGAPRARRRFAQRLIYSRRGLNSTVPSAPSTSASPSMLATSISISLMEQWRAVDIGPDGWRVIACPPVRFRRPAGMLPLPVPQQGGSIEPLHSFLNLASRDDFVLIVAWLLAALRPNGPYPLLAISGEQGSAKTVLSKLLKALIDSNTAPVRSLSREERELMITANNGYLLAFDNLSGLPVWLSDALCRLASGGSFAVRQLYTDDEEVLFEAARPILLNGIEDVISRPDLGDRAIFLALAPIGEARRRPENELWREFEIARPRILGALIDAVVHGLRATGCVHLDGLPRMADFALWATAWETALW